MHLFKKIENKFQTDIFYKMYFSESIPSQFKSLFFLKKKLKKLD